jgi:hypothetical protein
MNLLRCWLLLLVLAVTACGEDDSGFDHENSEDNLMSFHRELQDAIRRGDVRRAAALTRDLMPDRAALQKALRPDAREALDSIARMLEPLGTESDERVARALAVPEQRTEIRVHRATTEQIGAYLPGTPAYAEFPGGARRLAQTVLRPGTSFYEVEITEPGKDSGTKFHLFFWDGEQWAMLGPAWRVVQ